MGFAGCAENKAEQFGDWANQYAPTLCPGRDLCVQRVEWIWGSIIAPCANSLVGVVAAPCHLTGRKPLTCCDLCRSSSNWTACCCTRNRGYRGTCHGTHGRWKALRVTWAQFVPAFRQGMLVDSVERCYSQLLVATAQLGFQGSDCPCSRVLEHCSQRAWQADKSLLLSCTRRQSTSHRGTENFLGVVRRRTEVGFLTSC